MNALAGAVGVEIGVGAVGMALTARSGCCSIIVCNFRWSTCVKPVHSMVKGPQPPREPPSLGTAEGIWIFAARQHGSTVVHVFRACAKRVSTPSAVGP